MISYIRYNLKFQCKTWDCLDSIVISMNRSISLIVLFEFFFNIYILVRDAVDCIVFIICIFLKKNKTSIN